MAVVSVIASTAGRVLSVMWSRPIAFNQTVMVMDAAGKGFAFVCQGGQEKIATLVSYLQLMHIIILQNFMFFTMKGITIFISVLSRYCPAGFQYVFCICHIVQKE